MDIQLLAFTIKLGRSKHNNSRLTEQRIVSLNFKDCSKPEWYDMFVTEKNVVNKY